MTEKTCKVGDVVAWDAVPNGIDDGFGTLAKSPGGFYHLRVDGRGSCVGRTGGHWSAYYGEWGWTHAADSDEETVTIVALDVPADATAEHLRTLAERFEVREALTTDLALLKAVVEVKTTRHLWTDVVEFVPAVCSRAFGDGRALLALTTINSRPRFYVVRVDSAWTDMHERVDDIYEALIDEFGDAGPHDGDDGEFYLDWPAFDGENGASWGWITDDIAKRLHAASFRPREHTAADEARLLSEAQ